MVADAWQRLGVVEGATKSAVRRAYYARSLEWHPDRWSDQPEHLQEQAAMVFTLVADAYAELQQTAWV